MFLVGIIDVSDTFEYNKRGGWSEYMEGWKSCSEIKAKPVLKFSTLKAVMKEGRH